MKKSIFDFFINYEKTALQIFFYKTKRSRCCGEDAGL